MDGNWLQCIQSYEKGKELFVAYIKRALPSLHLETRDYSRKEYQKTIYNPHSDAPYRYKDFSIRFIGSIFMITNLVMSVYPCPM